MAFKPCYGNSKFFTYICCWICSGWFVFQGSFHWKITYCIPQFYSLLNLHCKRRINCLYRARNFWPPYCGRTIYNHDLLRTQTLHSNVSFLLVGRYDKKHFECFYAWIPFAKIIKADCFLVYFKSTLTISFHYFPLNILPPQNKSKTGAD